MNTIRGILHLSLRGYRTNRGGTSMRRSKALRKIEMIQPDMPVQDILADEDDDPEDLDACESDFMNVKEYDKMHERELEIEKGKLMTQIVKRKYFKSEEPAMLTWGEREQIRLLHNQDPEEWTAEKLSDSFPASREAILKVLRAKWSPKSAKVVEKYERTVKENWSLFAAGKLAIDSKLEAHFAKFKDRQIRTIDRETIVKKILKPKPEFPEPKSTMFSDIIKSCRNENSESDDDEEDELMDKKVSKSKTFEYIVSNRSTAEQESKELALTKKLATQRKISQNESLTVDQFLQSHVEGIRDDNMTPVDRVIVDEFKRQTTEDYKTRSLVFDSKSPVAAWKEQDETKVSHAKASECNTLVSESERITGAKESPWIVDEERNKDLAVTEIPVKTPVKPELANTLEGSLETGIIARQKTEAALRDVYPDYIQIPRKKYKPGVTYRVQDRYYDDDGELLYRVPGLKT